MGASVQDQDVREAFEKKYAAFAPRRDPVEIPLRLSKGTGWNSEDFAARTKLTSRDSKSIVNRLRGEELRHVIDGALTFRSIKNAPEEMKAVTLAAEEALLQIAAESPLNAKRVAN